MKDASDGSDRVRASSPDLTNRRIDREIEASVRLYATTGADVEPRLRELAEEWDIERVLEANAASLGLTGVVLGAFVDRRWLWLPGIVTAFLLQHAVQGWCPPVPLFRRFGIRTRKEIDTEKFALKALRGDFGDVETTPDPRDRARRALRAAAADDHRRPED